MMPRNLDRRVEAVVPVLEAELRERLREILAINLADDVLAWELLEDGTWRKVPTRRGLSAQNRFQDLAVQRARRRREPDPLNPLGRLGPSPSPSLEEQSGVVRAAGGAIWRRQDGKPLEVVVVHRPAYDDWSLPKGKADPDEPDHVAALREVREETGLICTLGNELPPTRYRDRHGRDKRVRYWAMTVAGGSLSFEHEVDEGRWVPIEQAKALLTYGHDADVLDGLPAAIDGASIDGPAGEASDVGRQ
jgi:8-oxo-dGTP pyrophosphatase MutT (NUDIX family)